MINTFMQCKLGNAVHTWDRWSSSSSTFSRATFLVSASSSSPPTSNTLSRYAWICTDSLSLSVCFDFCRKTKTFRRLRRTPLHF